MSWASAIVSSSSLARGTTRFTSPARSASAALMKRPVKRYSLVLRGPKSHGIEKYCTWLPPHFTARSANCASSLAMMRSQAEAIIRPPMMQ